MEDRAKWTVKDYQRALAARGAKVSGRKKELVELLEAYERNDNFGATPIIGDTDNPLPFFPEITKFRTLTQSNQGEVPKIARAHVEQYVLYRQGLKGGTMEKGEKMMGEIHALSFFNESAESSTLSSGPSTSSSVSSASSSASSASSAASSASSASSSAASFTSSSSEEGSNRLLYITGIVGAAMKKGVTYNMKLVIDDSGEVLQAHCECPAGRGPTGTCKHIVTVLLALVQFAKEGTLQVQLSCTEELQTFKKPKRSHQGFP